MKKGFTTLFLVIIVGAIALSLSISISLSGLMFARSSANLIKSTQARALANACAEVALEELRSDNSFTGTNSMVLGEGSCSYDVDSDVILAEGQVGEVIRELKIGVTISNPLAISSWEEYWYQPESLFCGGDGSLSSPYLICSANDLNGVRENLSAHYKLNNDVNLNIAPYNQGDGWDPIGTEADVFSGTFDGNGKTITGLYINRPYQDYIGLFGYINALPGNTAWVRNLGLDNINVTGGSFTGGLVGRIVGSWNAEAVIESVFVRGDVNGAGSTGGISGYTAYKSILRNVYSRTDITGGWGRGGIVGSHWGGALIIDSYSASEISSGSGAGGIFGQGTASNVTNSYWDTDLYPTSSAGTGKTTAELADIDTFPSWDIATSGGDINDGYPYLGWQENNEAYTWLIYSEEPVITSLSYWSLNEGSGCIAIDTDGDNDGFLMPNCPSSAPFWSGGRSGNALLFDGNDGRVEVYDSADLNMRDGITLSAWVQWNIDPSGGKSWATIINKNNDNQYRLQHDRLNNFFEFAIRTSSGNRWVVSTTTPTNGNWYHVAGTYDGSILKIYVNGLLENIISHSGQLNTSSNSLFIGNRLTGDRGFNGKIDEVRIWDRALSSEEILYIYENS